MAKYVLCGICRKHLSKKNSIPFLQFYRSMQRTYLNEFVQALFGSVYELQFYLLQVAEGPVHGVLDVGGHHVQGGCRQGDDTA